MKYKIPTRNNRVDFWNYNGIKFNMNQLYSAKRGMYLVFIVGITHKRQEIQGWVFLLP